MVKAVGHICFSFFNDSRIVNHLPFACNWQTRFKDSELVVTRFLSNTCGIMDIRIPCNSTELHPAPCMRAVCCMCGLGPSCMSKQNVMFLILLIPLAELTIKKDICRHHILCPLRLGPLFPNDGSTLRPKVCLGSNQMKIDLRKVIVESITYFWNK